MSDRPFYQDAYYRSGRQELCKGSGLRPSRLVMVALGSSKFARANKQGICGGCGNAVTLDGGNVRDHIAPREGA